MKMKQVHLKSWHELLNYLENPHVTVAGMYQILEQSKICWINCGENKEEILKKLKVFWEKYPQIHDRPLFL